MRLGLQLGYWGLGISEQDQLKMVREAEAAGYHSAWGAEAYGSDTATVLAWLAGQTETIKLGAGIFQMPARSPAMTAMTAATLDQLSNGRMLLGIGSSGPQVAEGWHGQRFGNQLAQRYGHGDAARRVQDLYLDGKRDEAMAALPDELIDTVSLCGPRDVVRERLAVYRDAGVGTLGVTPLTFAKDERLEQLRL